MHALYEVPAGDTPLTLASWDRWHLEPDAEPMADLARRARGGRPSTAHHLVKVPDGGERWVQLRAVQTGPEDEVPRLFGCAIDLTELKTAEVVASQTAARVAEYATHVQNQRERLAFLSQLTDMALRTDRYQTYLALVADAAVPRLGDWVTLRFRPEPGAQIETRIAHADPERLAWLQSLRDRHGDNHESSVGGLAVMRTGETQFVPDIDDVFLEAAAHGPVDHDAARALVEELELRSFIAVPLRVPRGVIGALELAMANSGRTYSPEDASLAQLAADRIAVALDQMWQSQRQRHIARVLQDALLPPALPDVAGLDVAVRYWPAGVGTEVGGDFYDVFQPDQDTTALVIGDVCGTGPAAAAVIGIARHTIRAAARQGTSAQDVLSWVNEAINHGLRHRLATAVYATITAHPSGTGRELTVASAGHPLPILLDRTGRPRTVGEPGTLLGVFDDIEVTPHTTTLQDGDTLVLYTDGITDQRPPHDIDDATLQRIIARSVSRTATADDVADTIAREVATLNDGTVSHDDVAVLVVRCTG